MSDRRKLLILGLLLTNLVVVSGIVWTTSLMGWSVWIQQTLIAGLFLTNLFFIAKNKL